MAALPLFVAATLHLLRSRFFSILIATLVLTGYSEVLRGSCSHEPIAAASAAGQLAHSDSDFDRGDAHACYCICHQSLTIDTSAAPFEPVLLTVLSSVWERAGNPPDAVPLGIGYPP